MTVLAVLRVVENAVSVVRMGENTAEAMRQATLSQSWAEGTLPGGAGTKSAKEWSEVADDAEARTAARLLEIYPHPRSTGQDFAYSRTDKAGKLIEGITAAGRIQHPGGTSLPAMAMPTRTTGAKPFIGADNANRRIWSIDEAGRWYLQLDDDALEYLRAQLALGASPVFRTITGVTDVTSSADIVRGFVTQGAWSGHIAQRVSGPTDSALVVSPQPLTALFFYGQSNAGGAGTATETLTTALYPYHAVSFSAGHQEQAQVVNPATLTDFVPLKEVSADPGPFQSVATAFAREARCIEQGRDSGGTFVRTDYQGGSPLSTFASGTQMYANLIASIDKAFEVAALYGRGVFPAVVFQQGEQGPNGLATYQGQFATLIDGIRGDVETAHGVVPPFLFWQTNLLTAALNDDADLAQRAEAELRRFTSVALIGPSYHLPTSDGVHFDELGRMMQGELNDLVLDHVRTRGHFDPLDVESAERTGDTIVITFRPPTGLEGSNYGLTLDNDWIDDVPDFGFVYDDDTSSAEVDTVTITGPWEVTITLTATPTGTNKLIRYARDFNSPTVNNDWLDFRGHLYADTFIPSHFNALGNAIPATIRHYCVAFQETLA